MVKQPIKDAADQLGITPVEFVKRALKYNGGNISDTARKLGVSIHTLRSYIGFGRHPKG